MTPKKVLVTPLDWGLGHATRCIPIIQELQKQNCEVQVGGTGRSLKLLMQEFSELKFHELPAYAPVYPKAGSMVWKLLLQIPKFLRAIREEHIRVAEIVALEEIDYVISDNRYGAWSNKIPCVFITHQLNILPPNGFGWLKPFIRKANYNLIKKFSSCWIPDMPSRKLTGDLSRPLKKIKSEYIGILSRFNLPAQREKIYDILVLLSGPEPQRSIFEDLLMHQLKDMNSQMLIVRGLVGESTAMYSYANIKVVNSLSTDELRHAIESSSVIIARSGYSTIMDLCVFQAKSILIPTPGQTEQHYLAKKLYRKGIVFSCDQNDFQLQWALLKSQKLKKSFPENDATLLANAINNLLSSSYKDEDI